MIPETTIVIAAYNEEQRLPETLGKIQAYLAATGHSAEIVVVDDGSTDNTASIVRNLSERMRGLRLISYPRNMDKGYALRKGVLSSLGRLVLVTDADLSTPIEELENLRPHLSSEAHQIAIGSRALPSSEIVQAQPPWRRGMSLLFNRLVKMLVIGDFKDTQCGFKLFTGEAARSLFHKARIDRFAYDVEILALARKSGYRIAEVPIRWTNSTASKVRPVLDSLQMLADLIKIRFTTGSLRQDQAYPALDALDRSSVEP